MRYWWVNQNQTFNAEVEGGFLWSPKTRRDGARNHFYDTMTKVSEGDVIFSFCDTRIKAMGLAMGSAISAPKPNFGSAGDGWDKDGWRVPVNFQILTYQTRPKDHIDRLRPLLPQKYAPLQSNGNGNQGVYLAEIPETFAEALMDLIGEEASQFLNALQPDDTVIEDLNALVGQQTLSETTRKALIEARLGQGRFKQDALEIERACRVTGVTDPKHLRASHIKPWRIATHEERLDGHNGLVLAPHVDHLFDKGYISFADHGTLLVSPALDPSVLRAWQIPTTLPPRPFTPRQIEYLAYHRKELFKHGT